MAVLELAAALALPARELVLDDGWWLRADDGGVVRRANAVFAAGAGVDPLAAKLRRAEAWYRERGRPVRFQLSPASAPRGLHAALRADGYRFEVPVLVLQRGLGPVAADAGPSGVGGPTGFGGMETGAGHLLVADAAGDGWIAAYAATLPAAEVDARTRLALNAPRPRAYASVGALACGLAVRTGELVGLFDLATAPAARRRGCAARITRALLAWGAETGALRAYLQVAEANGPAQALYARFGFRPAYRYRYAVREDPASRERAVAQ